jgi:hypothetical protein
MSTYDVSLANPASFDLPVVPRQRMAEEEFVAWCLKKTSALNGSMAK